MGQPFDHPGDPKELRSSLVPTFRHAVGDGDDYLNDRGLITATTSVGAFMIQSIIAEDD